MAPGCGQHPGCPCHPAGQGNAAAGRASITAGALGCHRGAEGPERCHRRQHGLPATILPEPLQEEGLVSRAWPRAGRGGHAPAPGLGGDKPLPTLCSASPPAQPLPSGFAWARLVLARGGCASSPAADGGTNRSHMRPPGEGHPSHAQSLHRGGECAFLHPHIKPVCLGAPVRAQPWFKGSTASHAGCLCRSPIGIPQSSFCPGRWGCDFLGSKLAGPCSKQQPCCTVPRFPFLTGKYPSAHPQPFP